MMDLTSAANISIFIVLKGRKEEILFSYVLKLQKQARLCSLGYRSSFPPGILLPIIFKYHVFLPHEILFFTTLNGSE